MVTIVQDPVKYYVLWHCSVFREEVDVVWMCEGHCKCSARSVVVKLFTSFPIWQKEIFPRPI